MIVKRPFLVRTALAAALFILTPWTFHGDDGLEPNTACSRQRGSCAREIDSVCTLGSSPLWNYYNQS
jgi:hypothetical protein